MFETEVPRVDAELLPWITAEEMAEVDRRMIAVKRISLTRMMENAGRDLARLAMEHYRLEPGRSSVLVLAGRGGNGGGALVAARRLEGWGVRTSVILSATDDLYADLPAEQLAILAAMQVSIGTIGSGGVPSIGQDPADEDTPHLILDGLIGYSLKGHPTGPAAQLIRFANAARAPVLSLDLPSGLHPDSGIPSDPAVRADATLTLALPKAGLKEEEAEAHVGMLYLGDIGIPVKLYDELGLSVPRNLFARGEILRVDR